MILFIFTCWKLVFLMLKKRCVNVGTPCFSNSMVYITTTTYFDIWFIIAIYFKRISFIKYFYWNIIQKTITVCTPLLNTSFTKEQTHTIKKNKGNIVRSSFVVINHWHKHIIHHIMLFFLNRIKFRLQRWQPNFNSSPASTKSHIRSAWWNNTDHTPVALQNFTCNSQSGNEIPSHIVLNHAMRKKIGSKWCERVHLSLPVKKKKEKRMGRKKTAH